MSFFNFRRGSNTTPQPPGAGQPETMDVIRKRAKHRLIGAAVLVLIGVVGFPLLFDAQPRPIAVDIPIEIPGKNTVKPLTMPGKSDAQVSQLSKPDKAEKADKADKSAKAEKAEKADKAEKAEKADKQDKASQKGNVPAAASLGSQEEIVADKKAVAAATPAPSAIKKEAEKLAKAEAKTAAKSDLKPDANPDAKSEVKTDLKPESKPAPRVDDGARAKALLDGKSASPSVAAPAATPAASPIESEQRLVVQVGAFADVDKAKEVRQKLEKAGLKTYTQVAQTKDGERTRVRVGPFASKAEAEKAAGKIKSLSLPASILAL